MEMEIVSIVKCIVVPLISLFRRYSWEMNVKIENLSWQTNDYEEVIPVADVGMTYRDGGGFLSLIRNAYTLCKF